MSIDFIKFRNFKALKDARLPLSRFTLLVGPNGSGKTTALQALIGISGRSSYNLNSIRSATAKPEEAVEVTLHWAAPWEGISTRTIWKDAQRPSMEYLRKSASVQAGVQQNIVQHLNRIRYYSLDSRALCAPVPMNPGMELNENGMGLAVVLDQIRDKSPEQFDALNDEFGRWLHEFDRILFDTPQSGQRSILLRTRQGRHRIPASELSQGTVLALGILTLAYLPQPPSIVCLEEPDRGLHPRLLRELRDALYRLAYPEQFKEKRNAVQVIATTHSPYLLDSFKDHPEEIVLTQKVKGEARFERLTDRPDFETIIRGAHLGEVWYSGILGGVPSEK